jgi:predicted peptidase
MAGAAGAAGTPGTGGTSGSGGSSFGPSSSRLVKHPIGTKYANQGYWEYLPPNPPAKSPLLVALHGVGENGSGDAAALDDLTTSGIPKLLKKDQWPNSRPFIVVAPQHAGSGCPGATEVYDFIDFASKNYGVDLSRVYLTGLSCGAIGGWGYLNKYLDQQVAAFVSIAGNGTGAWNNRGCELGKVPIWAFHGDADPTVNVSGSKVPLEGLMKCPSPPLIEAKLTIYPGVKHDSWTKTYDLSAGHDIYAWMLKFKHP